MHGCASLRRAALFGGGSGCFCAALDVRLLALRVEQSLSSDFCTQETAIDIRTVRRQAHIYRPALCVGAQSKPYAMVACNTTLGILLLDSLL